MVEVKQYLSMQQTRRRAADVRARTQGSSALLASARGAACAGFSRRTCGRPTPDSGRARPATPAPGSPSTPPRASRPAGNGENPEQHDHAQADRPAGRPASHHGSASRPTTRSTDARTLRAYSRRDRSANGRPANQRSNSSGTSPSSTTSPIRRLSLFVATAEAGSHPSADPVCRHSGGIYGD